MIENVPHIKLAGIICVTGDCRILATANPKVQNYGLLS